MLLRDISDFLYFYCWTMYLQPHCIGWYRIRIAEPADNCIRSQIMVTLSLYFPGNCWCAFQPSDLLVKKGRCFQKYLLRLFKAILLIKDIFFQYICSSELEGNCMSLKRVLVPTKSNTYKIFVENQLVLILIQLEVEPQSSSLHPPSPAPFRCTAYHRVTEKRLTLCRQGKIGKCMLRLPQQQLIQQIEGEKEMELFQFFLFLNIPSSCHILYQVHRMNYLLYL